VLAVVVSTVGSEHDVVSEDDTDAATVTVSHTHDVTVFVSVTVPH
jgi:hypothetical protein